MKTIKKIKESSKAVAGSALLVGATLAGGAAFATASSHNMGGSSGDATLGDYPGHFIGEDGTVSSTVVMGEDAAAVDVVAGAAIAGQLGNNAFDTSPINTGTSGGVAGTFSAENGLTLNRQNSDLFLNDATDAEESSLDASNLNILESTTFESYDSNEVDVEYEVDVGNQNQGFAAAGDLDDPVLHVTNPTNPAPGAGNNLMTATVEFGDSINFEAAGDDNLDGFSDGDEAVEDGDEIEMFGQPFTFSEESTDDELVFYGTSDRTEVNTGETTTVTVNGNELTVGSTFVSDSTPVEATVTVDGSTETVEEGDSVGPNGNIRVTDIFRTGPDGEGRVAFSQGSNELVIQDNGDIEVDGDDIDGVTASFNGGNTGISLDSVDEIAFHFGAVDSDDNYIAAGETYEDPLFGLEFHYGGLTGDTAENPAEAIQLTAEEDGAADVTLNAPNGEDSTTVDFVDNDNDGDSDATTTPDRLAYESGEEEVYATVEGAQLHEDNRIVLNANEEAGLYEVTDITAEASPSTLGGSDEEDYSVTVQNVVTGESVTVEETDVSGGDSEITTEFYDSMGDAILLEGESIEGKDFDVVITQTTMGERYVHFFRSGESSTQVFPTYYTSSDAGLTFTQDSTPVSGFDAPAANDTADNDIRSGVFELPSTVVSNDAEVAYQVNEATDDTGAGTLAYELELDVGNTGTTDVTVTPSDNSAATEEVRVGETVYDFTLNETSDGVLDISVGVDGSSNSEQSLKASGEDGGTLGPSVAVVQPEDDEDEEHAYFFTPSVEDGSDGSFSTTYTGVFQEGASSGTDLEEGTWVEADLDSEDGVEVGYNDYGTYTRFDSDDDAEYNFHLPSGQSTAGMAITGADGDLTEGGGSTGGSDGEDPVQRTPTGFSSQYTALDSDSSVSSAKQNRHLVLVGGPAVNSVVGELVEANETMAGSEYTEGQGMLQLVEDAFSEGHDALIVAGFSGEDTRAAGEFLVNHDENSDALEGSTQVTVNTAEGTVVQ
ncbi:S-layer protein [Nanohaloarchaea archaeon]|nr:S-layer protein [Candidatus Nanohaloarchaea archaeon]